MLTTASTQFRAIGAHVTWLYSTGGTLLGKAKDSAPARCDGHILPSVLFLLQTTDSTASRKGCTDWIRSGTRSIHLQWANRGTGLHLFIPHFPSCRHPFCMFSFMICTIPTASCTPCHPHTFPSPAPSYSTCEPQLSSPLAIYPSPWAQPLADSSSTAAQANPAPSLLSWDSEAHMHEHEICWVLGGAVRPPSLKKCLSFVKSLPTMKTLWMDKPSLTWLHPQPKERIVSQNHRTIEWPGLKRTSKIIWFQPLCCGQGHQPPEQAAQSHIQPGENRLFATRCILNPALLALQGFRLPCVNSKICQ